MRKITISTSGSTRIGRVGENDACMVLFPVAGWKEMYGDGTFSVYNQRPEELMAYPVDAEYNDETEEVSWAVKSEDVAIPGNGFVQLIYTVDDVVAKSIIYKTTVAKSLNWSSVVPEPYIPIIDKLVGRIEALEAEIKNKMEFYKVTLEQAPLRFEHNGEVLNYEQMAEKYNDDKFFLFAEYADITFIPSLPPVDDIQHDDNVLEFSGVWNYGQEQHITSLKINSNDEIKVDEFVCARKQ